MNTCITDNDITYIIMPRIAQESSKYLFPLCLCVLQLFLCICTCILGQDLAEGGQE